MSSAWRGLFLLPWAVAVVVLVWLINMRVPWSGVREFSFPLDGRSPWFDPFLPGERATRAGVQSGGWMGQRIVNEPAYAALRLPGVYKKVALGLEFRPQGQPLIDEGLRQEPGSSDSFAMQPLWSQALDRGWKHARWQDREGYVRADANPQALADTDMDHILTWHASTTAPLWMDVEPKERVFPVALRGSHDIQAVPVQGSIQFTFKLQDMNRRRERGTVVFSLSKDGNLLWSDALGLAGSQDHRPSAVYEKEVALRGLKAGVYKLSIVADDDVFLREIASPVRHWVFGPRLYFADQIGYATTTFSGFVWTNAHHIAAETFHEEGIQTLSFGSVDTMIGAAHKEYQLDRGAGQEATAQVLRAPRGDVRFLGDGYFALASDLLFLPAPRRLTDASNLDAEGIKAVLTPYVAPRPLGDGWYESSNAYAIAPRPGTLRMTIGAPGIQERKGSIDVRAVSLRYTRDALGWKDWGMAVLRELAAAWRSL